MRWRREAELGDAVWWIDGLPEKAFAEGFWIAYADAERPVKVVRYAKYIPMRWRSSRRRCDGTCLLAKMISWSDQ